MYDNAISASVDNNTERAKSNEDKMIQNYTLRWNNKCKS